MDQHVVVSGCSRGLGLEIAKQLLAEDYFVTAIFRTKTPHISTLQHESGGRLRLVEADLSKTDQLKKLIGEISYLPPVFGLINNAAIVEDGLLVTLSNNAIEQMIATNLTATILLTRYVAKQMIHAHRGRIINISSITAARAYRGLAVYSATKAGLEGFTRTLAVELGRRSITVNAIAPGYIETEMSAKLSPQQKDEIKQRTPLGEFSKVEDVAKTVLFLLSPSARMITGAVIPIDGGASL